MICFWNNLHQVRSKMKPNDLTYILGFSVNFLILHFHCTCKLDFIFTKNAFAKHLLSSHLAKLSKTWFDCYFKIVSGRH